MYEQEEELDHHPKVVLSKHTRHRIDTSRLENAAVGHHSWLEISVRYSRKEESFICFPAILENLAAEGNSHVMTLSAT